MKKPTLILIVALITFVNAKAQKHIGSKFTGNEATVYDNKDFVKTQFKKIVIQSGSQDIKTDKKIISEYKDLNVIKVSWLELFPPVKEYSDDDIKNKLQANEIDGWIKITVKSKSNRLLDKEGDMELSVISTKDNVKAVKCIGRTTIGMYSGLLAPEKTILKFVRLTYDDVKKYF